MSITDRQPRRIVICARGYTWWQYQDLTWKRMTCHTEAGPNHTHIEIPYGGDVPEKPWKPGGSHSWQVNYPMDPSELV